MRHALIPLPPLSQIIEPRGSSNYYLLITIMGLFFDLPRKEVSAVAKKVVPNGKKHLTIEQLLENGFRWIPGLQTDKSYSIQTDDSDGEFDAPRLNIFFFRDEDAHISTTRMGAVQIRTGLGGGRYPRTCFALEILPEAMRLDLESDIL